MPSATRSHPPVFHVTHAKTGSQWVYQVLDALFPHRIVHPHFSHGQFHDFPVPEGGIYPTLYLTREEFESVPVPAHHRKFFVMRDLRDTLVSAYFSLKHSHRAMAHDPVSVLRTSMADMTDEQGMEYLLLPVVDRIAWIQLSWLGGDVPVYRYEDALQNPMEFFGKILDHCELRVSHSMLKNVVDSMSFEKRSGRKRGEEDRTSHYRRGVIGDWQTHLKDGLLEKFYARYASVLVKTGYATAAIIPSAHRDRPFEKSSSHVHTPGEYWKETLEPAGSSRPKEYVQVHLQWRQNVTARPENALQQDVLITGTGWYPVEKSEGQQFCWVADEAELTIGRPSGGMTRLQLELDSGPSMVSLPATLCVLDRSGQTVTTGEIVCGKQWLILDLTACADDTGEDWELIFKVEGAGAAVAGDARTMSYRVFRFGWAHSVARQNAWGMEELV